MTSSFRQPLSGVAEPEGLRASSSTGPSGAFQGRIIFHLDSLEGPAEGIVEDWPTLLLDA